MTTPIASCDSRRKRLKFFGLLWGVFTYLIASGASAAIIKPDETELSINTRRNPDYDPQGIPAKGFTLYPSITNAFRYSDNIYASSVNQMHDFLYAVRPALSIKSDFERHILNADLFFEKAHYNDITSENYKDYGGHIDAKADVLEDLSIPLNVSYTKDHVRRGSPDEQSAIAPTVYHAFEGTTGVAHEGQNIALKILAGIKRFVFDDTKGLAGNIDNGDRDRTEYSLQTNIGRAAKEAVFAPFLYLNISDINYDRALDDNEFNRDAVQTEAGIGTIINFSDVTSMSLHAGQIHRSMEDHMFSDIDTMAYGINLKWEPSPLASFLLQGSRTIEETSLDNSSASINNSLRLSAYYELFPNVFLEPSIGILDRVYKGIDKGRLQTIDGIMQVTYKMNQNVWLSTSYQYINQDEKDPSPDLESYESNNYGASLRLQF